MGSVSGCSAWGYNGLRPGGNGGAVLRHEGEEPGGEEPLQSVSRVDDRGRPFGRPSFRGELLARDADETVGLEDATHLLDRRSRIGKMAELAAREDEVEPTLAEARLVRPRVPGVERAPARVLERRRVRLRPDLRGRTPNEV